MPKDTFFNTEDSKSMGILNLLNKELETNDYIEIPKHVKISKDPKWWIFTVLSFAGIFLGISIANFQRQIPLIEKTRDDLKTSITKRVSTLDELSAQISKTNDEINKENLLAQNLDFRGLNQEKESILQINSGLNSVSGPGIVIKLSDAINTDALKAEETSYARVFDSDLQLITNSLWASGAEAISINNMRISSNTAIRSAGDAILVNYRPLLPPYEIKAIGGKDMKTLFLQNPDYKDLDFVIKTYGLSFSITSIESVEIPAIGATLPDLNGIKVGTK